MNPGKNVSYLYDGRQDMIVKATARIVAKRCLGRAADCFMYDVRRTVAEFLADYDANQLTESEAEIGFNHLLMTGLVWQLPGRYGRIARTLSNGQLC